MQRLPVLGPTFPGEPDGRAPSVLHELEDISPFLLTDRVTQQAAQEADIVAEGRSFSSLAGGGSRMSVMTEPSPVGGLGQRKDR